MFLVSIGGCSISDKSDGEFSPFTFMHDGYSIMAFLSSSDSKLLNDSELESMRMELENNDLRESDHNRVIIGNDTLPTSDNHIYYVTPDYSLSAYIEEAKEEGILNEKWVKMRSFIGGYTGIQNGRDGYYYLKLDPVFKSSLNATFKTKYHLINLRIQLSYVLQDFNNINNMTHDQKVEFLQAKDDINRVLQILSEYLTTKTDKIYKPLIDRLLSPKERLYGFVSFWTEVKYNFAFFDQVPELDWDEVLIEYLPKVNADQSNKQYYDLLQEICAKLEDGHTEIYPPFKIQKGIGKPPLEFTWFEGQFFITNADKSLEEIIPLGSSLMSVDGIALEEYLEERIYPYISSSTEHIKRRIACSRILEGDINSRVSIAVMSPTSELMEMELERSNSSISWIRPSPQWKLLEYKRLKNSISYVSLNGFNSSKIVEEFETYVDSIRNTSHLIFDLRKNGGGNSKYAYEILKYFANEPFITSKWATREHKAAFKAWGSSINSLRDELSEWEQESILTFNDDYWYVASPDTIQPNTNNFIDIPCVILVGNETSSAAEDFLIAAENIPLGVTIGDYTYGSTGQPLHLRLPGGGSARICTKKDTYPDGREFVGYGIKPDYIVKERIEDILNNKDVVLDFAINYLTDEK